MCIYRPPSQNKQYFFKKLSKIIDHFSSIYDDYIILGDFNMKPGDSILKAFMQSHNLFNLIKSNKCFKGSGSCIALVPINQFFFLKKLIYIWGRSERLSLPNIHHVENNVYKRKLKVSNLP